MAGGASIPQSIAYGRFRLPASDRATHLATVRFTAPRSGTYRFEIGYGGNLAFLADLGFDPVSGQHTGGRVPVPCTCSDYFMAVSDLPLAEVWLLASSNPRRLLKLPDVTLREGGEATRTLFRRPTIDGRPRWQPVETLVRGISVPGGPTGRLTSTARLTCSKAGV